MLRPEECSYFASHLPFWEALTATQKKQASAAACRVRYEKGKILLSPGRECLGLLLVETGQLRAYLASEEGRELTLYRLLPLDVCVLSASCQIKNMNYEITIETEQESTAYLLPVSCFQELAEANSAVKNFHLEMMAARFSEVLWVLEQYVFGSSANRLAGLLLEHSALQDSDTIHLTHESMSNDLATAREVVTRLLRHFSLNGLISLSRGEITVINRPGLQALCR